MRYSKLEKLVQQLSSPEVTSVAAHTLSDEDVVLLPVTRTAPLLIGEIPIESGLYQMMIYVEFDAPDQGDGSPPGVIAYMDGVDLLQQGQGLNMPLLLFQGNLGPTQILASDRTFVGLDGTLEFSLSVENSAVADTDSAAPVTIDRVFFSLLG